MRDEAPCRLDKFETASDPDWPGSPCLLDRGLCLTCGRTDGLNWGAMMHETPVGYYDYQHYRRRWIQGVKA